MSDFKDLLVEWRYREGALVSLAEHIRHGMVLSRVEHEQRIADAFACGRLSLAERDDAILVDLVVAGHHPEDGSALLLVIEVAPTITVPEVHHAWRRATVWSTLGTPVQPVVAGLTINPDADLVARDQHVLVSVTPTLWDSDSSALAPTSRPG